MNNGVGVGVGIGVYVCVPVLHVSTFVRVLVNIHQLLKARHKSTMAIEVERMKAYAFAVCRMLGSEQKKNCAGKIFGRA